LLQGRELQVWPSWLTGEQASISTQNQEIAMLKLPIRESEDD